MPNHITKLKLTYKSTLNTDKTDWSITPDLAKYRVVGASDRHTSLNPICSFQLIPIREKSQNLFQEEQPQQMREITEEDNYKCNQVKNGM